MLEGDRAGDLEAHCADRMKEVFPKLEPSRKKADDDVLVIAHAPRLGRFRKHLLAVCELNRETWRYIRAETDDDHEWLPNPKQTGVIGLPVRNEMIDRWLEMVEQLEGLLTGERLFPAWLLQLAGMDTKGKGLNFKTLLDDPPPSINFGKIQEDGIDAKYLEAKVGKKEFDLNVLIAVWNLFSGPLGVAYMAWFN